MADINDVSSIIASALSEISVNGTLDVVMDGKEVVEAVGQSRGDNVEVCVVVTPVGASTPRKDV